MMTITTQTRKMIRFTLVITIDTLALITVAASASNSCDEAMFKQVYAHSNRTKDTHVHLDVACPHDYRTISCEVDIKGKDDHDSNKFFVAVNDSTPYRFDSNHNGYKLDTDFGANSEPTTLSPISQVITITTGASRASRHLSRRAVYTLRTPRLRLRTLRFHMVPGLGSAAQLSRDPELVD